MDYDCLIIDDEVALAQSTAEYFNLFDIPSIYATSYEEGLSLLKNNTISLIILDINLGDKSGFLFCKEIRTFTDIPIFFISVRDTDDDILMALGIGGDDYIKKPFTLSILLAKVKTVLKRYQNSNLKESIHVQNIEINEESGIAYLNGVNIHLKSMEFKLLLYLMKNKNKILTKHEIFENVWRGGMVSDSTLNVHIRRLREKIEQNPNSPNYIKTIWGTGYMFEVPL